MVLVFFESRNTCNFTNPMLIFRFYADTCCFLAETYTKIETIDFVSLFLKNSSKVFYKHLEKRQTQFLITRHTINTVTTSVEHCFE